MSHTSGKGTPPGGSLQASLVALLGRTLVEPYLAYQLKQAWRL